MRQVQEYWPEIIKEYREFEKIAIAENPELESVWQEIGNVLDDQFIRTATENGIARREKLLRITPFADDTLESRRFRVQALWNEKLPYTYRVLVNKLDNLCGEDGYVISLNAGDYELDIKIELTMKRMFDEVAKITRQMVPANLVVTVELRYNQHNKLAQYTHGQLSAFTHDQLRNEVMN
jgi:hypothetical protein